MAEASSKLHTCDLTGNNGPQPEAGTSAGTFLRDVLTVVPKGTLLATSRNPCNSDY